MSKLGGLTIKNIIFAVCLLLLFGVGVFLFEKIEDKVEDKSWKVVAIKILSALVALIVFLMIAKFFAGIFNITWSYPFV